MSLQVWLPLNGNLNNQGLATIDLNYTPTFVTPGKIGTQCLSSQVGWFSVPAMTGKKQMSFAYWVKINAGTTTNWLDTFSWYSTDGSSDHRSRQEFYYYNTNGNTEGMTTGVWYYNASNSGLTQRNIGEWYHYAFTIDYNTGITQFFVNGTLWKTTTNANINHYIKGTNFLLRESTLDCSINDFRLYDHILSKKEVEELSKGLVLHYKLDDSYMQSAENIMPNYLEMALGSANASTGTWRLAGTSNMTRERVLITDSPEGECYGFQNSGIQTANDGSCYGIDSFPLVGNSVYTISMWARIIDGSEGYAGYNIYNSTDKGGSYTIIDKNYRVTPLPVSGEWVKCWYTFTTNASNTRNIYIGITTGSTSVTTQMCCVHIEKVDNTADTVIYDSSGYNNNGELYNYDTNGLIAITSDSPRYNVSTFINSANNTTNTASGTRYIYGHCALTNPTTMSVAFWCKPIAGYGNSTGQGQFCTTTYEFGNANVGSDYQASAMNHRDSTVNINDSAGTTQCRPAFLPTANEWHHYVITYDGQTGKVYKDGIQSSTASFSAATTLDSFIGVVIGFSKAGGVWRSNQSYFSDFRVYITALTADQVTELYNTSVAIDNNGNIYSRELVEI